MTTTLLSDWMGKDCLFPGTLHFDWLTKPPVLTQALARVYGGPISIEVLNQSQSQLEEDECTSPENRLGLLREVFLMADHTPQVYARVTVANPHQELVSRFTVLGNRPLGQTLLYNNPQIVRSDFTYRHFPSFCRGESSKHPNFCNEALWARRSTFFWHEAQITVSEYFSPTIKNYKCPATATFHGKDSSSKSDAFTQPAFRASPAI
jgi:chorismate--pyruvate lyase